MPGRPDQCLYKERDRRCRRNGSGKPCLCRAHRVAVEQAAVSSGGMGGVHDALGELLANGRVSKQSASRAVADLFGMFGISYVPGHGPFVPRTGSAGAIPPPPGWMPRPQPQVDPAELERARRHLAARRVMGFAAKEPLTAEVVRRRRVELARKHHPDRGGDVATMARVNDAADVLERAVAGM